MMRDYESWEEAASLPSNKSQRAVARTTLRINGIDVKVDVIKPLHGDPWYVFRNTGLKISQKVDRSVVDSIRRWRPWSL
jgi:hypothetical protein